MRASQSRIAETSWYYPALILAGIIVVYPIARTIGLSFFHKSLATGFHSTFAGLDNFSRIRADSRFAGSLWTTAVFTVFSVAAEFAIGLLLALAVSSIRKWTGVVRGIVLVPWTLPTAVIAVLWAWILNDQYGVANAVLPRLGFTGPPIAWLAQPRTAMFAIIVADVWKTIPFVFIVILAGLQNIPGELYEAMDVDGGGAWEKFRYVTWPHLRPFAFVAIIFRTVQAFAVFDLVWVMTGGGPGGATETVSIYTYRTYMRYLDFGYGAALVVATVAILALVAAGLYRLLIARYEQSF
jgi:multiple sugar transport system permease protein